jgi:porin
VTGAAKLPLAVAAAGRYYRFTTVKVHYVMPRWMHALIVAAIAFYGEAQAQEPPDGFLGDWGGLRTILANHGVDLELSYINEAASNLRGGSAQETQDAEQMYFGGSLDLEQLAAVPGAKLIFSFTDRNGQSLSVKAKLNTLLEVQEIYGEGNWLRLNQFYWQQQLFDGRAELKFGRLSGTFDFMPFSCKFQNIAFCATLPSHNVVANWTAFPGSTWAGVARVNLDSDWYLKAGVYEINPYFANYQYRVAFGAPFGGLGKRSVAEGGWLPKTAGPDGGYRLGAWYDDVRGDDLYFNVGGQPLATRGGVPLRRKQESGFYAMAQQRLWAPKDANSRAISLFFNFVQTDHNISKIGRITELGLFWTGPLSARPNDDLGVAVGLIRVNNKVAQGELLYDLQSVPLLGVVPAPVQRVEFPTELYYSVNVTPAITLRPNIQFIHAPGGVSDRVGVIVLGIHSSVQF